MLVSYKRWFAKLLRPWSLVDPLVKILGTVPDTASRAALQWLDLPLPRSTCHITAEGLTVAEFHKRYRSLLSAPAGSHVTM